jgi:hypothetical protein
MRRSPVRALLAAAMLLLATGCGGGPDSHAATKQVKTIDAAFAARAHTVCAPYQAYDKGHPFPTFSWNRYDPDPKVLPRVAEIFARNPRHKTLLADLDGLGKPATGSRVWALLIDDITKAEDLAAKQIDSARKADAAAFVDLQNQIQANDAVLHQHLQVSGLPAGSACRVVEVDQMAPRGGH